MYFVGFCFHNFSTFTNFAVGFYRLVELVELRLVKNVPHYAKVGHHCSRINDIII